MKTVKLVVVIKTAMLIAVAGLIGSACNDSGGASENAVTNMAKGGGLENGIDSLNPGRLFTKADADKIMGEPTHLADSSTKHETLLSSYLCAYKANAEDSKTTKTGAVYFLIEQYPQIPSAQKKYTDTKKANERLGIEVLDHLGDEAYYHSDGKNFYFIMVRKGNKVFNIKVNKITSTTSLPEFKQTAHTIAASI